MRFDYPYTVEKDVDGFLFAQFIDLEEAFTQGETFEEVAFNASEVLSAMLAYRLEANQDIPKPSAATKNSFMAAASSEVQQLVVDVTLDMQAEDQVDSLLYRK